MAGTAGLDERFICTNALEQYFVDKDLGLQLANGSIEFWQDNSRTTPKLVYQLAGDPSNVGGYYYEPLLNPVRLSGVGTIQNAGGDNIALYYFPYQGTPDDSDGSIELYYVVVKDQHGVVQFTRSAWPNIIGSQNPTTNSGLPSNQISNSQFVDFHFYANDTASIDYSGVGTRTIDIAPDWHIVFNTNGAGTITFSREPIAGSSKFPTNPPYWLKIIPGVNITSLKLVQNMENNPAIWSTTDDGTIGYVNGGVLLDVGVTAGMYFVPSSGIPAQYEILNVTNNSGAQRYYANTVEIVPSTNANTGANGGVKLEIILSPVNQSRLSSVQLLGLSTPEENVPYLQETANRQRDYLFHYYRDALVAKTIPSFLVGWDFPLNPAQFGGRTQAASLGIDQSKYVWDQTILYQSVASSISVTGSSVGAIQLQNTAGAPAKFALIQYLGQEQARKVLSGLLSVQVAGCTNAVAGLGVTVSLWYTTDANLPSITGNLSIVDTLNDKGKPVTFNGAWTEVPVSDLVDSYGILPVGTENDGAPLNFSYWNPLSLPTAATTATYFAIVVGSAPMNPTDVAYIRHVSLVPGVIATSPAAQTKDQVLRECQYYYQKSYNASVNPGTATTYTGMKLNPQSTYVNFISSDQRAALAAFELMFEQELRVVPDLTLYSPVTGASGNVSYRYYDTLNAFTAFDHPATNWTTTGPNAGISQSNATFKQSGLIAPIILSNTLTETNITYHYVADARLGVI